MAMKQGPSLQIWPELVVDHKQGHNHSKSERLHLNSHGEKNKKLLIK